MLHAGRVYRREELARVSNAVDRLLRELVSGGALKRLAQGLYYSPRKSVFGELPPDDPECGPEGQLHPFCHNESFGM
jgi:hypothetical protein